MKELFRPLGGDEVAGFLTQRGDFLPDGFGDEREERMEKFKIGDEAMDEVGVGESSLFSVLDSLVAEKMPEGVVEGVGGEADLEAVEVLGDGGGELRESGLEDCTCVWRGLWQPFSLLPHHQNKPSCIPELISEVAGGAEVLVADGFIEAGGRSDD